MANPRALRRVVIIGAAILLPALAQVMSLRTAGAQGFIIPGLGSRKNGTGAAIGRPDDLSAIYHNPGALALLKGTRVGVSLVLGYPGETLETIEQTKAFVQQIPMTIMNLSKFTPYPGSPVYRELYGANIRDDHWDKMNGMNFLYSPDGLSIEELDRHYREILLSFYRRPGIARYYLQLSLRYPQHIKRLLKFGWLFFRNRFGRKPLGASRTDVS